MKTAVIAIGGNAILRQDDRGTHQEHLDHIMTSCQQLTKLIQEGWDIVLTHGNGPQVGNLLLQNEAAKDVVPPMPLDVLVAQSQGMIGYLLQQVLTRQIRRAGVQKNVIAMITQTLVDPDDPAFTNPTKPVGPFYSEEEAKTFQANKGWKMVQTKGAWRRVVPSPKPIAIVEHDAIKRLVFGGEGEEQKEIVIAVGGGGIPCVNTPQGYTGVEAVVDKDLATAALANSLGERLFIILTDVEAVSRDFDTDHAEAIGEIEVSEMRNLYDQGQFPEGSMGPKIAAVCQFIENGGEEAIITSPERLLDALHGQAGTHIYRDHHAQH